MRATAGRLLADDEPPAYAVVRPDGTSPYFLVCDHASNRIPRRLGALGLSPADLKRHIAWDAGAASLAQMMSERLDAALVLQNYSRLVIDCNRTPDVEDSRPVISEATEIPGNRDLGPAQIRARIDEIFRPYHETIAHMMDARREAGRATILVAVHSFTPRYAGWGERPWHIGILYNRDSRLPHVMLELLRAEPGLTVGDNEPYRVSDKTDYTIPVHGEGRGVLHVEIEVRQDEIDDEDGQRRWAERLCRFLEHARQRLGVAPTAP